MIKMLELFHKHCTSKNLKNLKLSLINELPRNSRPFHLCNKCIQSTAFQWQSLRYGRNVEFPYFGISDTGYVNLLSFESKRNLQEN